MKRLWRAIEVLAWTAFFVFAGLALALRFWVLPDIERYRGEIVSRVATAIGRPVQIGAIDAGWDGLRPQIGFSDVRIMDRDGREALVLPRVENVLSWRSLLHLELRLHSLAIEAPRLTVRRDPAGALYIAGLKLASDPGDGGRGADWVLSQDEIVVRGAEIEWRDELRGAPPLALSALTLRLRNSGDRHAIGITAHPPPELAASLELRAELGGHTVNDLAAWNGRLFAEVGYTDLAAWRPWVDYPVDIRQGQGALRLWVTLANGRLKEGTADLALAGVRASLGDEFDPLELVSLNGRVHGHALDDGVEFSGRRLALVMERGPAIPQTDFEIVWRPQAGGVLAASVIDLEATAGLIEALPVPPQLTLLLRELAPRGRLADTRLEWSGPFDAPSKVTARSRFSDFAMRPREGVPGFTGLDGTLEATDAKGTVVLATRGLEIDLPKVFPEPRVALTALNGRIEWQRQGDGVLVQLPSLSFSNADLSGTANGSYLHTGGGPGTIDLSVLLNRADGTRLERYLPLGSIMGAGTRDWLAGAILAGQASDVRLRLRGNLREFPFVDPASGEFRVAAHVEKGVLRYAEGWPEIRDIDAELVFERKRMDITARTGSILGARLANVRVSLPEIGRGSHLLISGQAAGPTAAFINYLQSSPLSRRTQGFTDAMSARGDGKLSLSLDLPLAELAKSKVQGDYQFSANEIVLHPNIPPLERAAGKLAFTESGFSVPGVKARLAGGSVAISGGPQPGAGIEIVARGDARADALELDEPWRGRLSGTARYVAKVSLGEGRARFTVDSPLVGVASTLPAPLAKAAAASLPLHLEIAPGGDGRERISLTLGRLAAAEVLRRRQGAQMVVQRAAVWVSPVPGQPVRLPERPGTLVYGTIPSLDLERWLALARAGQGGGASATLDVRIGALDAFGKRFKAVAVRAGADAVGWSATVKADEVSGELSYRSAGGGRLTARLERLTIPADTPGTRPQAAAGAQADLPAVDLVAEQFTFYGKELGRVEMQAQRVGADWRVDRIAMNNPDATFTAKGIWRRGVAQKTALDFNLEAADAGKFLARVGSPGLVRGGRTGLQGSLSWNGDPTAIDYASLSGDVQMQAENGQFLEVDPGLGKLISLMNLQALPRRIQLDFRDVFSKGFQFDRINSSGHVERGLMAVHQFNMRGSAAQVEMSGSVDLARETQDLKVRVIPSLGDSAAAALAFVNPLLIFPAAIAQRILKDPLGHIFSFEYAVTGTWANPNVRRTNVDARAVVPNDSR
jgi:uncharacterized protein (TIGR02099 family)